MRSIESLKKDFIYHDLAVNFGGLSGSTRSMVAQGWSLELECVRSASRDSVLLRIAGFNKILNLMMYSQSLEIDYFSISRQSTPLVYMNGISVKIMALAQNIVLSMPGKPEIASRSWNGMVGVMDYQKVESYSLLDLFHFPCNESSIFVKESKIWTIEEHLDAIRKAQEPLQDEILREKEIHKGTTKLQLIGVA